LGSRDWTGGEKIRGGAGKTRMASRKAEARGRLVTNLRAGKAQSGPVRNMKGAGKERLHSK